MFSFRLEIKKKKKGDEAGTCARGMRHCVPVSQWKSR